MKGFATSYCWIGLAAVAIAVVYKIGVSTAGFSLPWGLAPTSFLNLATPVLLLAIASSLCCEKK